MTERRHLHVVPDSGTTPPNYMDVPAEVLERALANMRARNDRAEAGRQAFMEAPWWHLLRRHKAWREWNAAVSDFHPFMEEVRLAQEEVKNGLLLVAPGSVQPRSE